MYTSHQLPEYIDILLTIFFSSFFYPFSFFLYQKKIYNRQVTVIAKSDTVVTHVTFKIFIGGIHVKIVILLRITIINIGDGDVYGHGVVGVVDLIIIISTCTLKDIPGDYLT